MCFACHADQENKLALSRSAPAVLYRRLIAFNPLISAILVNAPILGAIEHLREQHAILTHHIEKSPCSYVVAGLIYVLLKLRNHSIAVQQRKAAEQLLQSAVQAKNGKSGSKKKR